MGKRVDIRAILRDPQLRKEMMVSVIIAIQAREGVDTSLEQAEKAYHSVRGIT